jgi:2',3'-cyclic-nucleotide 2'-phosphodiesterase (5'-nucleotidase family)
VAGDVDQPGHPDRGPADRTMERRPCGPRGGAARRVADPRSSSRTSNARDCSNAGAGPRLSGPSLRGPFRFRRPDMSHYRAPWTIGFLLVLATCGDRQTGAQTHAVEPLHLRVIATHDLHGALRPRTYAWSDGGLIGGASALKAVMDTLESACACVTVRVDGGDQMQGTLESNLVYGRSVVAFFNHLGLDAAAVGNHELDWGVDTLLVRQGEARYAWLAANVSRRDTGERPSWATPFTIIDRGGVRIGVIGYATINTPFTLRPEVTEPYDFRSGYAGIQDALEAVWLERPDFVILAAHAGGDCNAEGCAGELVDLAAALPAGSVHLIAGGHNHMSGDGVVNGVPIVRAGANGTAVAVVDLYRLNDGTRAVRMAQQTIYADEVDDDKEIVSVLAPYLAAADSLAGEIVATLSEPLSPSVDRRLGYLIADAVRLVARADAGLHNPGAVRSDLPRGDVSYADLHRVMPFGNAVVRLTLQGRHLRELVQQVGPSYYFSNLSIEYESDGLIAHVSFADGTPIVDDRSYSMATNEFLADGGDGLTVLRNRPRESLDVTTLNAVARHLRQLPNPVELPKEKRETRRVRE